MRGWSEQEALGSGTGMGESLQPWAEGCPAGFSSPALLSPQRPLGLGGATCWRTQDFPLTLKHTGPQVPREFHLAVGKTRRPVEEENAFGGGGSRMCRSLRSSRGALERRRGRLPGLSFRFRKFSFPGWNLQPGQEAAGGLPASSWLPGTVRGLWRPPLPVSL